MRSLTLVFLLNFISFGIIFKISILDNQAQRSQIFHSFKSASKMPYSFFGDNEIELHAEILFQKQLYLYNNSNTTFDIWTAICDERFASSKGRTAVHVFVYMREKFEDDTETRKMLKAHWKCRMFYGKDNQTVEDTPLNAVISNHRNVHALMSCFFQSHKHKCPSYVSIVPGYLFSHCFYNARDTRIL